jgi:hypothetical protein
MIAITSGEAFERTTDPDGAVVPCRSRRAISTAASARSRASSSVVGREPSAWPLRQTSSTSFWIALPNVAWASGSSSRRHTFVPWSVSWPVICRCDDASVPASSSSRVITFATALRVSPTVAERAAVTIPASSSASALPSATRDASVCSAAACSTDSAPAANAAATDGA